LLQVLVNNLSRVSDLEIKVMKITYLSQINFKRRLKSFSFYYLICFVKTAKQLFTMMKILSMMLGSVAFFCIGSCSVMVLLKAGALLS